MSKKKKFPNRNSSKHISGSDALPLPIPLIPQHLGYIPSSLGDHTLIPLPISRVGKFVYEYFQQPLVLQG